VRGVAHRAIQAAYTAPRVPGVGAFPAWFKLPRDGKAQEILKSKEALYGRATYSLGPTQSYISTYPGSGLTPERIGSIFNEVLVAGFMLNKACLDEQVLLRDGHMEAVDRARRVAVVGRDFSLEPADDTELAQQVADYDEAWLREVDRFGPAMHELLFANLAGYAIEEAVYENKAVKFGTKVGETHTHLTVEGPHPRQFDWVSNKHTRFDVNNDELLLDCGNGNFVGLPDHKFLQHIVPGDFQKRRRGYMYQAVWLHLLKHAAMARWGVVLDIWGIPVPYGKLDQSLWQDERRKAESIEFLRGAGKGQSFLTTDDFTIEEAFKTSAGDARGMHAAMIGWVNQELSKLIQGETLTTELGGVGSYNASETHAEVKESIVAMDERALSDTLRGFLRAVNRLNAVALSKALNAPPEEILRVTPIPYWRIERAVTPQVGLNMIDLAVNKLRLPIAAGAVMRQYGFPKARSAKDLIKGQTEIIPEGATSANTMEAGANKAAGGGVGTSAGSLENLELTPSAQGAILTVNEAREHYGLDPVEGGERTISEAVSEQLSAQAQNNSNQEKSE
jgi:phage gp29-like protein